MGFLANFTAIDFETANRRTDSACQLAAVVVREGETVREQSWLIRPDPFYFAPGNIRIHGIRPADVEHEPTFAQRWDQIREFVENDCLIAHNASFDIGVLLGCLQRHQLPIPDLNFSCTRLIARQTWTDRRRYGLKPLANWLGVDFCHHDALEDSRACASILLAAGIANQAKTLDDLETKLKIVRGRAGNWGIKQASRLDTARKRSAGRKTEKGAPKRTLRRGRAERLFVPDNPFDEPDSTRETSSDYSMSTPTTQALLTSDPSSGIDWQRVSIRAEFIQPLRGKQIVIHGTLKLLSNEQAIEITKRGGGIHQVNVDQQTNCVVIGSATNNSMDLTSIADQNQIEVLTEPEFLRLLGI